MGNQDFSLEFQTGKLGAARIQRAQVFNQIEYGTKRRPGDGCRPIFAASLIFWGVLFQIHTWAARSRGYLF
jgi:hypothetical protein